MRAAARRARATDGPGAAGGAPPSAPAGDASTSAKAQIERTGAPSKAALMNLLMTFGGMSAADAAREYELQLREHHARKG